MANGYSIFIGLVIIAAMCGAAWVFAPKGENQVYVLPLACRTLEPCAHACVLCVFSLWRSSLILTFISCYLMWAITFLAQLNPLIEPRRSGLRKDFVHH